MNTAMLENPITQDNLATLKNTASASLSRAWECWRARMSEKENCRTRRCCWITLRWNWRAKNACRCARYRDRRPDAGILDPVRYLTNHSSGRMGYAIAREAMLRGAQVTLISGSVSLAPVPGVAMRPVTTAKDMLEAVQETLPETDILIKAAAVADYRPATVADQKIKRKTAT